jgi:hypothetical protein
MIFDRENAETAALAAGEKSGQQIDSAGCIELDNGWFFPWTPSDKVGSSGVIISKTNGSPFVLGSAFPVERDLRFYEKGYTSQNYDLVVLETRDRQRSVEHLTKLGVSVVEPEYEAGTVWRIARPLGKPEIEKRLNSLPCVFADVKLYFKFEILETVEAENAFVFKALPRP